MPRVKKQRLKRRPDGRYACVYHGIFFYKGKPIYLTSAHKKYLAEWLLTGNKDNSRRMILCNLRKKFGVDFLADIDRFGQPKRRIEDEQ